MQIAIVMLLSVVLTGCAAQYAATTCAVGDMNGAAKVPVAAEPSGEKTARYSRPDICSRVMTLSASSVEIP